MAEIVVSAFFTVFFEKLASEALKKLANSKGIDTELKKLKRSLNQIKALLNDASNKEISDEAVKEWLNGLQHLAYDIDDVLDELATEAIEHELTEKSGSTSSKVRKLIPTCCTNFSVSTRMHRKLDDITIKLQELVDEKDKLGLSVKDESPKNMNRRLETSLVDASSIVGREGDKDALLEKLLGDESCEKNYNIVPIVGMGGIGKTTLARLLYDEKKVKDQFELKAWVCVSDEFDIFKISKTIFESVGGGNQEFSDLNRLQLAIKEKISKKRFLIVLDDVWSESYAEWEIFERPFLAGAYGSKIIMTTRKELLLTKLGYNQPCRLSVLSHENALSLFCQNALGENNFASHPRLEAYGEGIVKKCNGLPLALIALGRLLRTKTDEEKWMEVLNSEIWSLGNRNDIVPALTLSYLDLSASLKLLFAYCSLFPKDYEFDKKELILLWMAEGFLLQSTPMERLGDEYFDELLSRTFFQHSPNDKSKFVMHDLMNDMATYVAGVFFSRLDVDMKKEFRKEDLEMHRHMSFVCEEFMAYQRFEPFRGAKSLRTFLAVSVGVLESWQSFYLSNKVLNDLLQELPFLRVLSLSDLSISELPEVVGGMRHLRYLNLSRTLITLLPENVCNLYNLQTLIVSGSKKLINLPKSFSKLKKLQHLDITNTPLLKKMPLGIGLLKSLQTLTKVIVGVENGFLIAEFKSLINLQGKISILELGNVQNAMEVREANLPQKRLSELELDWGDISNLFLREAHEKEVLNELKPHNDTLKQLKIVSYGGTEFPNWVGDPSFLRLTKVSIYDCPKCTCLPRLGQLPSLKELHIRGMTKVKAVDLEFLGTGLAFHSLEILSFEDMLGWEVWKTTNSGVVDAVFPCLQELSVKSCPNLVQVSLEALPSLRLLKVRGCGHGVLISLVSIASSVTKLIIEDIAGLTTRVWTGVIGYLGAVVEVHILGCKEIRYLWESEAEASEVLVNLRILVVQECSNLLRLGEEEMDICGNSLTSLNSLIILDCNNLEHCSCPDSIESLEVRNCDSVTSISFPAGGGQKLKSITMFGCTKLSEKELGGGEETKVLINSGMRMLEDVCIHDWPNLKSITALGSFIHLTTLALGEFPSMESFPDHEFPNLTSLRYLEIKNCQSMDASFPRGLWPPNLHALLIGRLKKPIAKWGPQNFPTSLAYLTLWGGPYDDVRNFGQLSHLFPSSLTGIDIVGFEKVESVSMGLQHLTSLQHLFIENCPEMIDLPEMLLPSLLRLRIYGCPKLKEKISKGGSYWSLISHIPCVGTD